MELAIILLVAFLIFGPKRLPDVARSLGKAMYQLKNAQNSFAQEISKEWHKLEVDGQEEGEGELGPEGKDGDKSA
jgi:TatA/E family protein of Tat protein translocase